jgi:ubiquinol-cytochrome c reductase iron-sulfur subunit
MDWHQGGRVTDEREGRRGRGIALCLGVSAAASIGLMVVYLLGGQVQWEGALLGLALGGIALGLVAWSRDFMPGGVFVEERESLSSPEGEEHEAVGAIVEGAAEIRRRSFLVKLLGTAAGALGIAALFPIRSLGSRPGRELFHTPWSEGARVVTLDDVAVRADALDVGGVLTVFPEGHVEAADAQALLIRLEEGAYDPLPGREQWAPGGLIAFSKICTHAGCPVGLYQRSRHALFCPCHQSAFDVMRAATPTSGPATRPLPQLPLAIDEEGFIVARGDFTEPVGPGFWSRPDA